MQHNYFILRKCLLYLNKLKLTIRGKAVVMWGLHLVKTIYLNLSLGLLAAVS